MREQAEIKGKVGDIIIIGTDFEKGMTAVITEILTDGKFRLTFFADLSNSVFDWMPEEYTIVSNINGDFKS
jgi:hypothetical protein